MNYLGIDLGGTNIEIGIVNADNEIIYTQSFKTKDFETAEACCDAIFNDLNKNTKESFNAIGIGAPSVNYFSQQIENAPNLNWGEIIPIAKIFEDKFDVLTTAVNDANAAALGEWKFGGAKDCSNFALITLGTGVGIGLIINDEIYHGASGLGGEFGHIIINRKNGRECKCGNYGCLEAYVGKNGIIQTAKQKIEFSSGGTHLDKIIPSELVCKDIFKFARKEDAVAVDIIDTIAEDLGYGISLLANSLDLNNFYLFGGIANEGNFLKKKTLKVVKNYISPIYKNKININISELLDVNAAILGAAYLARKADLDS